MSDLISKGNPLKKFGRYWPTPVIEEVAIFDDHIDYTTAIYLNFDAATSQEIIDATVESMTDLNIYVFYVIGKEYIDNIINKNNVQLFNELAGMDSHLSDSTNPSPAWYLLGEHSASDTFETNTAQPLYIPNYVQLNFAADFIQSGEVIYDESGDRIYKYINISRTTSKIFINNINLGVSNSGHTDSHFSPSFNSEKAGYIFSNEAGKGLYLSDMSLFAFSSPHDYHVASTLQDGIYASLGALAETPVRTLSWREELISDSYRYFAAALPTISKNLMIHQYSDVSHELLFKDREIFLDPEIIYMDIDGAVYTDVPLQSITAQYYETNLVTHEEIVDSFKELTKETPTDDDQLKSVVNSITYALEINGEKADLLPQLDIIRKAFPDKSTTTAVGKLYERFKNRIISFNDTISKSRSLKPELIKNPKIVDGRTLPETVWTPNPAFEGTPEIAQADGRVYIYASNNANGNPAYITKRKVWPEFEYEVELDPEDYFIQRYGYFFFDFEKALRQTSALAYAFDIDKVQSLFGGPQTTNRFYMVDEVQVGRYGGGQMVDDLIMQLKLSYENNPDYVSYGYPVYGTSTLVDEYGNSSGESNKFAMDDGTNSDYVGFLRQRNWTAYGSSTDLETYRLMCFEFQESANFDNTYGNYIDEAYNFNVTVYDNTWEIAAHITSSYDSIRTGSLYEYAQYAEDECSYNNFDGKFNSFFRQGVVDLYSNESLERQPWILAPILYETHRDLLFNHHKGDVESIKDTARNWSQQINPYNGNIGTLRTFQANFEALWTDYYTPDTPIGTSAAIFAVADKLRLFGIPNASGVDAGVPGGKDQGAPGQAKYYPGPVTTEIGEEWTFTCPPAGSGPAYVVVDGKCVCPDGFEEATNEDGEIYCRHIPLPAGASAGPTAVFGDSEFKKVEFGTGVGDSEATEIRDFINKKGYGSKDANSQLAIDVAQFVIDNDEGSETGTDSEFKQTFYGGPYDHRSDNSSTSTNGWIKWAPNEYSSNADALVVGVVKVYVYGQENPKFGSGPAFANIWVYVAEEA